MTTAWVARFTDRMNLLLSMDDSDTDRWAAESNILTWYYTRYEIGRKFMSSVRDARVSDVLDLTTLLHGILFCGAYTSELQDYLRGRLSPTPHELYTLGVAVAKEND